MGSEQKSTTSGLGPDSESPPCYLLPHVFWQRWEPVYPLMESFLPVKINTGLCVKRSKTNFHLVHGLRNWESALISGIIYPTATVGDTTRWSRGDQNDWLKGKHLNWILSLICFIFLCVETKSYSIRRTHLKNKNLFRWNFLRENKNHQAQTNN